MIRTFFKPTKLTLILFSLLLFILFGAYIQGSAFSGNPPIGGQQSFLYNVLSPFPLWTIWMYLAVPIMALIPWAQISAQPLQSGIVVVSNVLYFYFLSCCAVAIVAMIQEARSQKKTKGNKKKIILPILILTLLIGAFPTYFAIWTLQNKIEEKIIDKAFHEDVKTIPNIKVTRFMLWEGDSRVDILIDGTKKVGIWYGVSKIPSIESIDMYNPSFDCFAVDKNGHKKEYIYSTGLGLSSDNASFKKWFPFNVDSLHDLVVHYDDIVAGLKALPHNPPLVQFNDKSGSREVRITSDPDFIMTTNFGGKKAVCDLYTRSY